MKLIKETSEKSIINVIPRNGVTRNLGFLHKCKREISLPINRDRSDNPLIVFQMSLKIIIALILFSNASFAKPLQKNDDKIRAFAASVQGETSKNYPKAIQGMLDILDSYKTDYLVHLRLGWLYYSSKEYETSIKYYKEAIRLSDNSIESLLGITMPYAELKKWDNVQDVYKNIIAKDKYHYTANLRLGQIYFNVGNYVGAKKYFETVYENYPGDYETNLYMGWNYYYLGSRTKAQFYFIDAIVLNSSDTSAKQGLELTK